MAATRLLLGSPASQSLIAYGTISIVNGLTSRVVMTKFFFDYPIVILMLQSALLLFAIEMGRMTKLLKLQVYTFQRSREMFLPSLFYALSSYFTLSSLDGITMPFYPFVHRFLPVAVIVIYRYLLRRRPPSLFTLAVVAAICIGSALASTFEINLDPWGILCALMSIGMMAVSLALVEKLHEHNGNSTLDLIYMNAFNCLCLFLLADLVQDEIRDAFMYLDSSVTPLFVICLIALIVIGAACTCVLFYCVARTNALNAAITYNCSSSIQVIVACVFSIYIFYDLFPDAFAFGGVALAVAATALFYISPSRDAEIKPHHHHHPILGNKGVDNRFIAILGRSDGSGNVHD